jgi:hypothetical protein
MRLEHVSPCPTEGYKTGDVAITDWPYPATELADAFLAHIWEEERGYEAALFRPANSISCQSVTTDASPPGPRPRYPFTAPLTFYSDPSLTVPFTSPVVHADYFYHNVAYYARKKFKDTVGYAFLRGGKQPVMHVNSYRSVGYDTGGLDREDQNSDQRGRSSSASSNCRKLAITRGDFSLKGRRLAHSAVHRFTIVSITYVVSIS